ncbi:putative peptidyl-tRNA hydrolase PTRHD1 isoform X2 [Bemisia tabaci]
MTNHGANQGTLSENRQRRTYIINEEKMATEDYLIQYVLVRGDLAKNLKWPLGAVIAQACHACVAAIHLFQQDPHTQAYLNDLNNMHKAVLEVPNEDALRKFEATFKEKNIDHKIWVEQPENIPTCIALKPYPKQYVKGLVKNLKLMKD